MAWPTCAASPGSVAPKSVRTAMSSVSAIISCEVALVAIAPAGM